jgi:CheY-like chemotaxis protein
VHAHTKSLDARDPAVPSIILLDINMPVMDGYEAAQRIRAYEKKHRLTPATIVAITALESEAAQAEAHASGFNMFLSKPVKLRTLTQILEGVIEEKDSR